MMKLRDWLRTGTHGERRRRTNLLTQNVAHDGDYSEILLSTLI